MVLRPPARLLALLLVLLLLAAGWPAVSPAEASVPAAAAVAPGHLNDALALSLLPATEAPAAEVRQAPHAADSLADLPEGLATPTGVATLIASAAGRCAGRSKVLAWPYLEGLQRPPCAAAAALA